MLLFYFLFSMILNICIYRTNSLTVFHVVDQAQLRYYYHCSFELNFTLDLEYFSLTVTLTGFLKPALTRASTSSV